MLKDRVEERLKIAASVVHCIHMLFLIISYVSASLNIVRIVGCLGFDLCRWLGHTFYVPAANELPNGFHGLVIAAIGLVFSRLLACIHALIESISAKRIFEVSHAKLVYRMVRLMLFMVAISIGDDFLVAFMQGFLGAPLTGGSWIVKDIAVLPAEDFLNDAFELFLIFFLGWVLEMGARLQEELDEVV